MFASLAQFGYTIDRACRYLLSAYYQGGYAAVHPLRPGRCGWRFIDRQTTAPGAHAILTDSSNRFVFVPHIARLNDNVLEPAKENPGPNVIFQFRFDAQTGRLSPNAPLRVEPADRLAAALNSVFIPGWILPISPMSRAAV